MRFLMLFLMLLPILLPAKNLRCDICGKKVRGRYIVSGNKTFCSAQCFEKTLPNCAVCRKKIREGHEYKGKKYCSIPCMKTAFPKCDVCGNPIAGTYKKFETAEGRIGQMCLHCSRLSRCFACELPAQTTRLPDGRHICRECEKQRMTPEEEKALFWEIKQKVEKILGKKNRCPVKLRIVDSLELKRLFPDKIVSQNEIKLGTCHVNMKVQTINEKKKKVIRSECTVYLLSNMPRGKFIDSASHELAHHWQYHQYPFLSRDPLKIPEGFAEYVSSLVNDEYGQPEYNRRKEKRRDPVYGAGFRMYRKIAGRHGLPAVFNYMKQNSSE